MLNYVVEQLHLLKVRLGNIKKIWSVFVGYLRCVVYKLTMNFFQIEANIPVHLV